MRAAKLLVLSSLVFFCTAYAQPTIKLKPLIIWQPLVEMDEQIFPSYLIATATMKWPSSPTPHYLGEWDGQIGISIISQTGKARCRLEIKAAEIMEPSVSEYVLENGQTYEIFPKIKYRFDALSKIEQLVPVNVTFTLHVNGEFYDEKFLTIKLHSVNDCPSIIMHRKGGAMDRNFMFAAYVNENHPWITNPLLPEIMKSGLVNAFTGYQVSEDEVYRQVFAVWTDFQRRGFRYSSVTVTPSMSPFVRSQYVRFLSDALNTSQANCVDGTVLFASVLRRIGIDPVLVLTPDHCFLGFFLDRAHQRWAFLETTLLGNTDVAESSLDQQNWAYFNKLLMSGPVMQQFYGSSLKSFACAIQVGYKNYSEIQEKLKTPNLEYQIIDVSSARQRGVIPISR